MREDLNEKEISGRFGEKCGRLHCRRRCCKDAGIGDRVLIEDDVLAAATSSWYVCRTSSAALGHAFGWYSAPWNPATARAKREPIC